jgi:hypothetical protein
MSFYLGCYLIEGDSLEPKHDNVSWELPDTTAHSGHMSDTSNVEELLINPEDMDLLPTQIQFGSCTWTDDESFNPTDTWSEFYARDEAFYVRGFSPTDYWAEFYPTDEAFYVRGFSPTHKWAEFYVADEAFYVRGFSVNLPSLWADFYASDESFYVRNFTATPELWQFYLHETGHC